MQIRDIASNSSNLKTTLIRLWVQIVCPCLEKCRVPRARPLKIWATFILNCYWVYPFTIVFCYTLEHLLNLRTKYLSKALSGLSVYQPASSALCYLISCYYTCTTCTIIYRLHQQCLFIPATWPSISSTTI